MYEKYLKIIRDKLDDYRYFHSLAVADEAERLAIKYRADPKKAYLAGLLHDITKNFSEDEHLKIFKDFDIILSDTEMNAPKLWHSISGSIYVDKVLNINDSDVVNAIRYHTTGKDNMTLLELIIFVADFTSADRDYPDVNVMRELANRSLYSAVVYALEYTINDLSDRKLKVHPNTLAAFDYYKSKII